MWLTHKLSLIKPLLKSLLREVMGSITIATTVILLHSCGWKSDRAFELCRGTAAVPLQSPASVAAVGRTPQAPLWAMQRHAAPTLQCRVTRVLLPTWHRAPREGNARLLSRGDVPVPSPCAAVSAATALQQSRCTLDTARMRWALEGQEWRPCCGRGGVQQAQSATTTHQTSVRPFLVP